MARPKRPKDCPVCGKPPSPENTPFCSDGCRDRDLLKWLGDGYRVPGPPADPESLLGDTNGVDSDG
jgi:hypothetical protein